jgi:hypothetical protein
LVESKFTRIIIIGCVAVTAGIAAIDFAGTVAFGVDYGRLKVTQPEYPRIYSDWTTTCKTPKNRGSNTKVENFLFATVLRAAMGIK